MQHFHALKCILVLLDLPYSVVYKYSVHVFPTLEYTVTYNCFEQISELVTLCFRCLDRERHLKLLTL